MRLKLFIMCLSCLFAVQLQAVFCDAPPPEFIRSMLPTLKADAENSVQNQNKNDAHLTFDFHLLFWQKTVKAASDGGDLWLVGYTIAKAHRVSGLSQVAVFKENGEQVLRLPYRPHGENDLGGSVPGDEFFSSGFITHLTKSKYGLVVIAPESKLSGSIIDIYSIKPNPKCLFTYEEPSNDSPLGGGVNSWQSNLFFIDIDRNENTAILIERQEATMDNTLPLKYDILLYAYNENQDAFTNVSAQYATELPALLTQAKATKDLLHIQQHAATSRQFLFRPN